MSDIVGHVDARDRPIVSLSIPGQADGFLVVVDTGFNGELLIYDTEIARVKCEITRVDVTVEFADREQRTLELARSQIVWFGQPRNVKVWITTADQRRGAIADEPIGLLGTALLSPHKLAVDFASRRVVISEQHG